MRLKKEVKRKILSFIGLCFVRFLYYTSRIQGDQKVYMSNLIKEGNHVIFAFWHCDMLIPGYLLRHKGVHALVSQHSDGQYLANAMEMIGITTIRGSTSRGGARAMVKLAKKVRDGHAGLITPDGPRGPRCVVQPGIIFLAKKTGVPIVPVNSHVSRCWRLGSWDKFVIPKPFAKVTLKYGEQIHVPSNLGDDELAEYCDRLGKALNAE